MSLRPLIIVFFFLISQKRAGNAQAIMKYEKKILELESLCKHKTDECYEAWMSLTDANEQLEQLKMKLDTRLFQSDSLGTKIDTGLFTRV